MPLQKQIDLQNGVSLTSGYIYITSVLIDYVNSVATINVNIYKDSAAKTAGKPEVFSNTHMCTGTSFTTYFAESVLATVDNTTLTQAYIWLLTLTLYSDATVVS